MCSINGFLKLRPYQNGVEFKIQDIMIKGSSRGKDSFGYACFDDSGVLLDSNRYLESSENCLNDFKLPVGTSILLSNNRAEPTTEYFENKSIDDIQPYLYGNICIVHNGTIANDKQLIKDYSLQLTTNIDSAVIAPMFESLKEFTPENIKRVLTEVLIGSFSLAVYNKDLNKLVLATNYKPLSLLYRKDLNCLFFSSLEKSLEPEDYNKIYDGSIPKEVKPYTALIIDCSTGKIEEVSLYKELPEKKKAVVCASAGMDSTVAASWAIQQGYEVTLLHFNYKCRAEKKENECIKKIAEYLECELVTIPIDFIKDIIGHSSLVEESAEINKDGDGIAGAELAHEWVPARNLIFMSIAAGYCEANKIDFIILGGNLEESGCILNLEENLVRMADNTTKMPADVNVGDSLMSWNFEEKKFEPAEVVHKFEPIHKKYYEIICDGRQFQNRKSEVVKFYASEEHPFWVKTKGWVEVKDLKEGDIFMKYANLVQSVNQSNPETNNGAFKKGNLVGDKNPMFGHIRSETELCWCGKVHPNNVEKIRNTVNELFKDPIHREKVAQGTRDYYQSDDWVVDKRHLAVSESRIRYAERIEKLKEDTGYTHWNYIPEVNKKLSDSIKLAIEEGRLNPANNTERPTRTEKNFIDFFEKYSLPFEYKGDGQIWITSEGNHMNPDFINKETKKVIEVTTKDYFFHTKEETEERKRLFEGIGWGFLYLYDTDLEKPDELAKTVEMFNSGFHNGLKIREIIVHDKEVQMYNYHCEPNNNFFIGKSGVLTHNSFSDNELIFQQKFGELLPNSLNLGSRVQVLVPMANLMKKDIVALGVELGAPLHLTWSCYENGDLHCDRCGPCFMRRTAFKMNHLPEVIEYLA